MHVEIFNKIAIRRKPVAMYPKKSVLQNPRNVKPTNSKVAKDHITTSTLPKYDLLA